MSRQFATDVEVMRHALALAEGGVGFVEPNPPVGAVVVDSGRRIVGEGWHQQFGGPHAEVFALAEAGAAARGATLFVTLEPCCHFGKTPPCTQAIIAAGISRVVAAVNDPAPHASGGGIREIGAHDLGSRGRGDVTFAQVVEHDDPFLPFEKLPQRVRADVARASGDEE